MELLDNNLNIRFKIKDIKKIEDAQGTQLN